MSGSCGMSGWALSEGPYCGLDVSNKNGVLALAMTGIESRVWHFLSAHGPHGGEGGRERARHTFSQLDGDPPSSPDTDSRSEQKTRSPTKYCALCPKEKPCRLNGDLEECDHCTKGNNGRYFYCLSCR